MIRELILACGVLCLPILQAAASPNRDSEDISYRLPDTVFPELYHLDILTNLADMNDNFTFQGTACIQVKYPSYFRDSADQKKCLPNTNSRHFSDKMRKAH